MRSSTLILQQAQDEVLFVTYHFKIFIQSLSTDEPTKGNPNA
jgi:hypothetical protein